MPGPIIEGQAETLDMRRTQDCLYACATSPALVPESPLFVTARLCGREIGEHGLDPFNVARRAIQHQGHVVRRGPIGAQVRNRGGGGGHRDRGEVDGGGGLRGMGDGDDDGVQPPILTRVQVHGYPPELPATLGEAISDQLTVNGDRGPDVPTMSDGALLSTAAMPNGASGDPRHPLVRWWHQGTTAAHVFGALDMNDVAAVSAPLAHVGSPPRAQGEDVFYGMDCPAGFTFTPRYAQAWIDRTIMDPGTQNRMEVVQANVLINMSPSGGGGDGGDNEHEHEPGDGDGGIDIHRPGIANWTRALAAHGPLAALMLWNLVMFVPRVAAILAWGFCYHLPQGLWKAGFAAVMAVYGCIFGGAAAKRKLAQVGERRKTGRWIEMLYTWPGATVDGFFHHPGVHLLTTRSLARNTRPTSKIYVRRAPPLKARGGNHCMRELSVARVTSHDLVAMTRSWSLLGWILVAALAVIGIWGNLWLTGRLIGATQGIWSGGGAGAANGDSGDGEHTFIGGATKAVEEIMAGHRLPGLNAGASADAAGAANATITSDTARNMAVYGLRMSILMAQGFSYLRVSTSILLYLGLSLVAWLINRATFSRGGFYVIKRARSAARLSYVPVSWLGYIVCAFPGIPVALMCAFSLVRTGARIGRWLGLFGAGGADENMAAVGEGGGAAVAGQIRLI